MEAFRSMNMNKKLAGKTLKIEYKATKFSHKMRKHMFTVGQHVFF